MPQQKFTAVYQKQGRWTVAWIEELPGVNTQGRTKKEARENLQEALQLVLESNRWLAQRRGKGTSRELLHVTLPQRSK